MIPQRYSYTNKVRLVQQCQFGILSPKTVKEISVVQIFKPITNHQSYENTVKDPRLGAIRRGEICPTCRQTYIDCPGHFGHIVLAKPLIQTTYYNKIIKIMRMICNRCSAILFNKDDQEHLAKLTRLSPKMRFKYLSNKFLSICPNCRASQPKYKQDKNALIGIQVVYPDSAAVETQSINAEIILHIFKSISDEDIALMGLDPVHSRPDSMIWTIFPVPPLSMRPSVVSSVGSIADDDLTHKLNDIVKLNSLLSSKLNKDIRQKDIHDYWNLLQYHVDTYVNNNSSRYPQATHRSGRPLKTIEDRISGKGGRIRGNLMGKRVNGAGRSVITADPNISLDQLGVPREIAVKLLIPEYVTESNKGKLHTLVANGMEAHPGARSYLPKNETFPRDLSALSRAQREDINLQVGDIVYRQLMDGDIVLFNRQPSLHRMSMMGHYVKVLPGRTFRLNVNATSPYNADFDGDEMNMHVAQSMEARAELHLLASVPTQIISPQASRPVIGLVQDSLLGAYMLSKRSQGLTYQQMMALYPWFISKYVNLPEPSIKEDSRWSPYQLMSLFFPDITYKKGSVKVERGQVIKGDFGKPVFGATTNSLFHVTWNDRGPLITRDFINHISWVAIQWLVQTGFSVGYSDCVPSDELTTRVHNNIIACLHKVRQLIREVNLGISKEGISPQLMKKSFPGLMIQELNECRRRNKVETDRLLDPYNRIALMVNAGSKGNPTNIGQIMAQLGQQELEGSWIPDYFHRRPLTHFPKNVLDPEARGFIVNSFYSGLNPTEYWFHAQVGRLGVISKTIKTADTGYLQRQLVKMLEDVKVDRDLSVRSSKGHIIQTIYGGDGFDPKFHEKQRLPFLTYNNERLILEYQWLDSDLEPLKAVTVTETWTNFQRQTDSHKQSLLNWEFQQILNTYSYLREEVFLEHIPETVDCPINIDRILRQTKLLYVNEINQAQRDLDPLYVISQLQEMFAQLQIKPELPTDDQQLIQRIFRALVLSKLASKRVIFEHQLSRSAFDTIIKQIKMMFWRVVINPGESVGVITAQSIGEPTTQMTLDTFHHTGIGSKANVSRGVPRIEELIGVRTEIKTPSMTIYLKPHLFKNMTEEQAKELTDKFRASIEYTTLGDLITSSITYYDPEYQQPPIHPPDFDEEIPEYPWLLRIYFSRSKLSDKLIFMEEIGVHLYDFMMGQLAEDQFYLQVSDSNDAKLQALIWINPPHDPVHFLEHLEYHMKLFVVQGIQGISRGVLSSDKIPLVMPDGSIISPYDLEYDKVIKTYQGLTKEYKVDTEGSNLLNILTHPLVDSYRTISNNVVEIYRMFGIEAARSALIKEIDDVITFSGSHISRRHLELLVDVMVNKGILIAISRNGITKTGAEVFHRVSFEDTISELTEAGFHSEIDHLKGVSSNIMFGQFIPAGTGMTTVNLDIAKLAQTVVIPPEINAEDYSQMVTINQQTNCMQSLYNFRFVLDEV